MKLNKTAVALAIASIASAPMIASADTTLSGVIEINVAGSDADDVDAVPAADEDDETTVIDESIGVEASNGDATVGTGDVIFGIVSEQELNNGLTGFGSIRLDLDQLSNDNNQITTDSVFTGVKGGFGEFRLGEIPLAVEYGQTSNDIFDVGAEISGGLSYIGNFGPVGLILNYSPDNNQEAAGAGVRFALGGFSIGLGGETRGPEDDVNAAVGVAFAFAGAAITAHYWTQENGDQTGGGGDDLDSFTIQAGFGLFGTSASVTYALLDGDADADQEAIRLDVAYDMGGGTTLSGRVTNTDGIDPNGNDVDSLNDYRIQLAKSF